MADLASMISKGSERRQGLIEGAGQMASDYTKEKQEKSYMKEQISAMKLENLKGMVGASKKLIGPMGDQMVKFNSMNTESPDPTLLDQIDKIANGILDGGQFQMLARVHPAYNELATLDRTSYAELSPEDRAGLFSRMGKNADMILKISQDKAEQAAAFARGINAQDVESEKGAELEGEKKFGADPNSLQTQKDAAALERAEIVAASGRATNTMNLERARIAAGAGAGGGMTAGEATNIRETGGLGAITALVNMGAGREKLKNLGVTESAFGNMAHGVYEKEMPILTAVLQSVTDKGAVKLPEYGLTLDFSTKKNALESLEVLENNAEALSGLAGVGIMDTSSPIYRAIAQLTKGYSSGWGWGRASTIQKADNSPVSGSIRSSL